MPPTNPLTLDLVQTDNSSGGTALDGFVTNDLLVNSEDRLLGFQLALVLEEGSIYQDPFGADLPPNKIVVETLVPSLAYDTFLAMGSPYANGAYGIFGPFGKAVDIMRTGRRGGASVLDEQSLDVAWSTAPGEEVIGVEDFLLSRVTLSDDAKGYWAFLGSAASSPQISSIFHATVGMYNYPEGLGVIEDGVMDFTANIHYSPFGNQLPAIPRIPITRPKKKREPPRYEPRRSDPTLGKLLSIVQRDNSSGGPSLAGFVTNDLLLSNGAQLTSFQLYLKLGQGQIFQDPLGGNTAPAEGLAERGFPSLEFDTFVALGADTAGGPYGTPGIAGGAVNFSASPQVEFDNDTLSIVWYGAPGVPMLGFKDFLLSRISLSEDAIGSWGQRVGTRHGARVASGSIDNGLLAMGDAFVSSQVVDGQWFYQINDRFSQQNRASKVPEPTTCILALSLLGLLLLRRQHYYSAVSLR